MGAPGRPSEQALHLHLRGRTTIFGDERVNGNKSDIVPGIEVPASRIAESDKKIIHYNTVKKMSRLVNRLITNNKFLPNLGRLLHIHASQTGFFKHGHILRHSKITVFDSCTALLEVGNVS